MYWLERMLKNLHGAPKERRGLIIPACRFIQHRQIVDRHRHVHIVSAKNLLLDRQRPPVQPLGFCLITPRLINRGQIIQDVRIDVSNFALRCASSHAHET